MAIGVFSYILTARYVFLLKINLINVPLFLMILYLFTSFFILVRGFTSFTWFIIPFIFSYYPSYVNAITPPLDNIPPNLPQEPTSNYGGFTPRHNHNITIIILHYLQDLTYIEIADSLLAY